MTDTIHTQPELSDDELLRVYGLAKRDHNYEGPIDDWPKRAERAATVAGLRAAIAADRARRPPQPVPVSERLPGAEDCDAERRCWIHMPDIGTAPSWRLVDPREIGPYHTHWLPAHALPVPGEVEG